MSLAAEAFNKSGPYAPAFFLAFAVAAGGLRTPADWLLFGVVFLSWAALIPRGFSAAAPAAPLLFFSWLAAAAVFSGPAASLKFSRYAVFGLLFFTRPLRKRSGKAGSRPFRPGGGPPRRFSTAWPGPTGFIGA